MLHWESQLISISAAGKTPLSLGWASECSIATIFVFKEIGKLLRITTVLIWDQCSTILGATEILS